MTARQRQLAILLAPAAVGAVALVALPPVITLGTALLQTDRRGPSSHSEVRVRR